MKITNQNYYLMTQSTIVRSWNAKNFKEILDKSLSNADCGSFLFKVSTPNHKSHILVTPQNNKFIVKVGHLNKGFFRLKRQTSELEFYSVQSLIKNVNSLLIYT